MGTAHVFQTMGCMHTASSVLGLSLAWCDLFVWSPEGFICHRIHWDDNVWNVDMLPPMRAFYFEQYLPYAADKLREERGVPYVKREKYRKARKLLSSSGQWQG